MTQTPPPRLIVTRARGIITHVEVEGIAPNERGRIELPVSSLQVTDKVFSLPIVGMEFHTGDHLRLVTISEDET